MKAKPILLLVLGLMMAAGAFAQAIIPCVADESYRVRCEQNPRLKVAEAEANRQAREEMAALLRGKKAETKIIPVVFHVMYDVDSGLENISQAQIMDQIRIMNEDYRKKAGTNGGTSTDPLAVDMEIEFRLAQFDPAGLKHDGINRVQTDRTNSADDDIKSLSYWDSNRYLNIWVVKFISTTGSGTVLGRGVFPWEQPTQSNVDGILVRHDYVGTIGTGKPSNAGRTLTHEAGHWLGLYHPFQDGCVGGSPSNCNTEGDLVCDTPPVNAATNGCPATQNSCTNDFPDRPDLVKNYMDYANGTCTNMFTAGQKARVYGISFSGGNFRGNVTSVSNLNSAGIDQAGNYLPVAAAARKVSFAYGFDQGTAQSAGFTINNFNNPANGWQVTNVASYGSNNSFEMRNFMNSSAILNSRDGFQLPEIDLSTAGSPWFTFYYAYAKKTDLTNDTLVITISGDFGMHEYVLWKLGGTELETVPVQASEFIPTSQSQWKKVSLNLVTYRAFQNARIRFELLNRRGNNIFVDELSVSEGPLGIREELTKATNFRVNPNPVDAGAEILFTLAESANLRITAVDLLGRECAVLGHATFASGEHSLHFSKGDLKAGMYFIRLEGNGWVSAQKLLIN